jgi:hypothetical protein
VSVKERLARRKFKRLCRKYGTTPATIASIADSEEELELVRMARLARISKLAQDFVLDLHWPDRVNVNMLIYPAIEFGVSPRGRRYWFKNTEPQFIRAKIYAYSAQFIEPSELGLDELGHMIELMERARVPAQKV